MSRVFENIGLMKALERLFFPLEPGGFLRVFFRATGCRFMMIEARKRGPDDAKTGFVSA